MQAEGSDDEDHECGHAGTKANLARLNNNGDNDDDDCDNEGLLTPRKLNDNDDEDDEASEGEVEDDLECYNVADEYNDDDNLSWTVSIGSDEYYTDDEDEDETEYKESPMRYADYSVKINNIDTQFEEDYIQEVSQLKKNVMKEYKSRTGDTKSTLSIIDIINVFFPMDLMMMIINIMNGYLSEKNKERITVEEFTPFLRSFFWLCYYGTSVAELEKHAYDNTYPRAIKEIDRLKGTSKKKKLGRFNDLLRSLEGGRVSGSNSNTSDLYFDSVYDTDTELLEVFRRFGGHVSKIARIKGHTDMIVDDEKQKGRSEKANDISIARSKSNKAFGPVGNTVCSTRTGIPLSNHVTHHGESATDTVMSNLTIITGDTNQKRIDMGGATLAGDRGYNDEEIYQKSDLHNFEIGNTVKRGPKQAFKFGKTGYKTNKEQRDVSEKGPALSLGATRAIGDRTIHQTLWRNGVGRCTMLQSTDPTLSHGNMDYITQYEDIEYGKKFAKAVEESSNNDGNYNPESLLSETEKAERKVYDDHNVMMASKGQGGDEWRHIRFGFITSTKGHVALPRKESELQSEEEIKLLRDDLGRQLEAETTQEDEPEAETESEAMDSHQHKSVKELVDGNSKEELINICKAYGRTYSGKNKDGLAATIKLGPTEATTITDQEKFIRNMFLTPLADKDRSAHKLGSKNEAKVRGVLSGIADKLGYELHDSWESGLLFNKQRKFLATSVDGWLQLKKKSNNDSVAGGEDGGANNLAEGDESNIVSHATFGRLCMVHNLSAVTHI